MALTKTGRYAGVGNQLVLACTTPKECPLTNPARCPYRHYKNPFLSHKGHMGSMQRTSSKRWNGGLKRGRRCQNRRSTKLPCLRHVTKRSWREAPIGDMQAGPAGPPSWFNSPMSSAVTAIAQRDRVKRSRMERPHPDLQVAGAMCTCRHIAGTERRQDDGEPNVHRDSPRTPRPLHKYVSWPNREAAASLWRPWRSMAHPTKRKCQIVDV